MSKPIMLIGNILDMCAHLQPNSYLWQTGIVGGTAGNSLRVAEVRPYAGGLRRLSETGMGTMMPESTGIDFMVGLAESAERAINGSDKCGVTTGKRGGRDFYQDYHNGNFNKFNSSGSHSRQSGWPPPEAQRNWISPGGGTAAAS